MRLKLISCGAALIFAAAAHATTIDNFTLTSGSDVITFSIPEPATPSSFDRGFGAFGAARRRLTR